ncbi:MAG TPA: pyruvate dehydrogenase complex E1 component subunit beta [Bryobacteraceae bacterium]|jgi:pyruvate/2-oxoglutarate/acetoin dehydrogenase E1 component|nr:pyruvate dehydrogenase complex E1 component subunit beta [Bryobacteraceae bacterium]
MEHREITYGDAGAEALREEMARDETIVYIGQGIGPRGGNFRQTKGLWGEFGDDRLRDTGIIELAETGAAIGAAMAGSRAIVDNVFLDFSLEAMTQIIQQAANARYLSNGKLKVPVMIRGAMGSVRNAGVQHSHTFYAWFAHTPGLKVVVPSTPYDVKGLMKTALRDDGPVMFIEHKSLYNIKGEVPSAEYVVPFGKAKICREGKTATVVAVSRMVYVVLEAAQILEQEDISLEVIDPRTIAPLDRATIADSIRKTGRVAVVDEAHLSCGFSGEVVALACEECFDSLDAPPKRICARPAPNAFSPKLENEILPGVDRVVSEIRDWMNS